MKLSPKFINEIQLLISKHKEGDTLLWHTSPQEAWSEGVGNEGYALIRDGYFLHSISNNNELVIHQLKSKKAIKRGQILRGVFRQFFPRLAYDV
ncbi:hypothetical protein BCS58_25385 [Enterovibrio norvegicus]|uniref:hypothetical protein n=1 Tax=Enterovibrio norvegicus TaxID=188144 RepID=UPI00389B2E8A